MKRPFSPLVWLCCVSALALGALALFDPSGVYAGYIDSLGDGTPPIAAVFTAAQDGVYPWSGAGSDVMLPGGNSYWPLTETVTDDEMRSSVGENEPFADSPAVLTPSVEVVSLSPSEDPVVQDLGPDAEVSHGSEFIAVDKSWFDDALFIGDSYTEGLCDYGGMSNATFYYKRGLDIWSVMKKSFVNGRMTVPQALSQHRFGKIYILLGINEIACGTAESYAAQYADVVSQLRELQPDALIYVQAIFHTTQKKSDTSNYNNDRINERNAAISTIADGEHVFFVDCNAVFDDATGALTSTYSGDGVHLKAPYYTMWRDYLLQFGRADVTGVVSDDSAAPPPDTVEPEPQPEPEPEPQPEPAVTEETEPSEDDPSQDDTSSGDTENASEDGDGSAEGGDESSAEGDEDSAENAENGSDGGQEGAEEAGANEDGDGAPPDSEGDDGEKNEESL